MPNPKGDPTKAIPPYEIERHWYLHELRLIRAAVRITGASKSLSDRKKSAQRELCKSRKGKYGK